MSAAIQAASAARTVCAGAEPAGAAAGPSLLQATPAAHAAIAIERRTLAGTVSRLIVVFFLADAVEVEPDVPARAVAIAVPVGDFQVDANAFVDALMEIIVQSKVDAGRTYR